MRLCMFHPVAQPMERGWVGRVDGEHVIQLAAQTLESFFTGGGGAREHAVYPLDGVHFLAPVLHPPSIRLFEDQTTFEFANPAAIVGPDARIPDGRELALNPRIAAVIGAEQQIAGFTGFADWRRAPAPPPKDRDFALGLGPVLVTADELPHEPEIVVRVNGGASRSLERQSFDWEAARSFAGERTELRPGDLLVGPRDINVNPLAAPAHVEIDFGPVGTLRQHVR